MSQRSYTLRLLDEVEPQIEADLAQAYDYRKLFGHQGRDFSVPFTMVALQNVVTQMQARSPGLNMLLNRPKNVHLVDEEQQLLVTLGVLKQPRAALEWGSIPLKYQLYLAWQNDIATTRSWLPLCVWADGISATLTAEEDCIEQLESRFEELEYRQRLKDEDYAAWCRSHSNNLERAEWLALERKEMEKVKSWQDRSDQEAPKDVDTREDEPQGSYDPSWIRPQQQSNGQGTLPTASAYADLAVVNPPRASITNSVYRASWQPTEEGHSSGACDLLDRGQREGSLARSNTWPDPPIDGRGQENISPGTPRSWPDQSSSWERSSPTGQQLPTQRQQLPSPPTGAPLLGQNDNQGQYKMPSPWQTAEERQHTISIRRISGSIREDHARVHPTFAHDTPGEAPHVWAGALQPVASRERQHARLTGSFYEGIPERFRPRCVAFV